MNVEERKKTNIKFYIPLAVGLLLLIFGAVLASNYDEGLGFKENVTTLFKK